MYPTKKDTHPLPPGAVTGGRVMVYGQQARHRDVAHQATPSLKRVLDIHS